MPPVQQQKRQRADRRKTVETVTKAYLKKPRGTVREIAKETGLDFSTVAKVKRSGEIPQTATKDNRIVEVTDTDLEIVTLGTRAILRRIKADEKLFSRLMELLAKRDTESITEDENTELLSLLTREGLKLSDVNAAVRDSAARYMVLRGDMTGQDGSLNQLSPEQLKLLNEAQALLKG